MIPQKHFYMIRHGQTEANVNKIMAGSSDSPLTAEGRDQARAARIILENLSIRPTLIVHSNLSRARDTAMIMNENLNLPMKEDPDIAEIHVGELEGRPWSECMDLFENWVSPPGGETMDEFFERVRRSKNAALSQATGPALIVSHGGVFRALWKMYGHDIPGVRNCHMHEFNPQTVEKFFPWQTFVYDYDSTLQKKEVAYHRGEFIAL